MDDKTRIILLKIILAGSIGWNIFFLTQMKSLTKSFESLLKTQRYTHEMGDIMRTVIEENDPSLMLDPKIRTFLDKYEFETLMEFNEFTKEV